MANVGTLPQPWVKVMTALVEKQMELSAMVDGQQLSIHRDNPAIYFAALNTELGELLNHFNWKPWKLVKPVAKDDMAEEWADCFAFFLILTAFVSEATGMGMSDLMSYHVYKTLINEDRFTGRVEGYGGPAARGPEK